MLHLVGRDSFSSSSSTAKCSSPLPFEARLRAKKDGLGSEIGVEIDSFSCCVAAVIVAETLGCVGFRCGGGSLVPKLRGAGCWNTVRGKPT